MLTALQAHLQDEELPMALRARLHKAQLQIDSAQLDRLADQLAIRLTLHYQHSHPILICRKRQGLVLTGMLLRRLGFVLSIAELQQDLSIQSEMSLEGRIVMLLDGQYEEAKGRDAVTAMLEQQQVQQVVRIAVLERSTDQPMADDSLVPPQQLAGAGAVPLGCGFELDGVGANLPDLYFV